MDVQGESAATGASTQLSNCGSANGQTWYPNLVWPQAHMVTGTNDETTIAFGQGESSVNVSQGTTTTITVGYNQFRNPNIDPGWVGWSTWNSASQQWSHQNASGQSGWVTRPDNALASDPGASATVFFGFLAHNEADMGEDGDGFCIMKSTDSGQHFTPWGCMEAAADGMSMAAFGGHVYFGVWNLGTRTTDIYTNDSAVTSSSTTFSKLPGVPFPSEYITTHPRLKMNNFGTLTVAAISSGDRLLINRFDTITRTWGTEVLVTTGAVGGLPFNEPGPGSHPWRWANDVWALRRGVLLGHRLRRSDRCRADADRVHEEDARLVAAERVALLGGRFALFRCARRLAVRPNLVRGRSR
jgi:hypothetical protein